MNSRKNKYLSRLTTGQVISSIGVKLVDEIKAVLPFLPVGDSIDVNSSAYLKEVFSSFVGSNLLIEDSFREVLFNLLNDDELRDEFIDFCDNADMQKFRNRIISLSWGNKNRAFCEHFLKVFGFPATLAPIEQKKKMDKEYLELSNKPYKQLQDYQLQVYLQASEEIEKAGNRFIIQMPTGSGKTRTAVELIVSFLNNSKPGTFVVWIAHSSELCSQAEECFQEVWGHAGKHPLMMYRCWNDHSSFPQSDDSRGLVICGFDKLNSILTSSKLDPLRINDLCGLIVIDEAHKAIAPTYKRSISHLAGLDTRIIGLTATPGRSTDDFDQNKELSSFFNDKKITFSSDSSPILYLRNKGVLAKAEYVEIEGIKISESHSDLGLGKGDDFSHKFLDELGEDSDRNVRILRSILPYCKSGLQIIYFAPSVNQSRFISSCLTFSGFKSSHVDSSTLKEDRYKLIDDYRNGSIQVICNYGVLTTGFDAPKTDVVFIARPTSSIVLYSQMVGRGLRGPKVGGKETCVIAQVRDNVENFEEIEKLFGFFDSYFK